MSIPQSFIQELLARADVVDIVGKYVQLKKGGANFMGLCPFHGEKSPSFSVSPAKQFYHCFGCGKNGNAISFLMEHAGMTFIEAVKDLAQQYGLQVPEDDVSPQDRARAAQIREQQATLTSVLEKAGVAYMKNLRGSDRAIAYFKGRGLSGEIAKTFGLGYAPEGWRNLASVFPDYNDPLLVESGLVIAGEPGEENAQGEAKRYDRFRDRVMFPIRNVKGECIGFGGRVLGDEKPKYLNSPETPVFSKGRELYGLFEARTAVREHGYALVTEGYMDVVALAQLGFANAVATLGTACTADHVQKLFRFTDSVVFSFDGDGAGRRAARKALDAALPFATDVRTVKFLFLPAEHDPDSYIREHGKEGFAAYVSKAVPLSRFMLDAAAEGCDLDTAEGRAHMASNAKPLWSLLPDGAMKPQLLAEIADKVMIDSRDLLQVWQPAAAKGSYKKAGASRSGGRLGQQTAAQRMNQEPPAQNFQNYPEDFPGVTSDGLPHDFQPEYDFGGHPPAGSPAGYEPYFEPASAEPKRSFSGRNGKFSKYEKGNFAGNTAPRRVGGRVLPVSRADHAARLMLSQPDLWESLTSEQHAMLAELPKPHGPLFTWIEIQLHEHGPQPWAALREGLRGHELESLAMRLMASESIAADPNGQKQASPQESSAELRQLLNRLLIERLKAQETEAIEAAATDPSALQRYRELQARRRQLEAAP